MRGKFLFGAASAALLALSAPALAQSGDQAGDNTTQARLTTGDAVEGDISQGGDLDWFRMSVERGQRYRITLDGVAEGENAAIDPLLVVYGADGGQLAFNDDTGGIAQFRARLRAGAIGRSIRGSARLQRTSDRALPYRGQRFRAAR